MERAVWEWNLSLSLSFSLEARGPLSCAFQAGRFCRSALSPSLGLPEACSRGFFLSVLMVSLFLFGAEPWLVCVFHGAPVQGDVGWAPPQERPPMREKWQLGLILVVFE